MTGTFSETELSPLDQIRLTEAEITRRIVAAREDAERRLAEARTQAARIKKQAREEGTRTGKVQFKEILSRAEEEARAIIAHARNQAENLHQKGHSHMELAVEYAVSIVLGLDKNGRADEP
jgi:V/A-type H+-transporting ATPase subunit G/H